MKNKNRILICIMIAIGFVLVINNGCKKANNTPTAVTDKDGNVYKTITIGTQLWMAENLKTTKYRNGDLIGTTTPATLNISSENTPKYQWSYDGNESNVAIYGRLYTWYAVADSRNVCPIGWHVPNDIELTTLTSYLGGESVAGGKLKEAGTTHWTSPNTGATNESGFALLPSGTRFYNNTFYLSGSDGYLWSTSETSNINAHIIGLSFDANTAVLSTSGTWKGYGFSVRCLKD